MKLTKYFLVILLSSAPLFPQELGEPPTVMVVFGASGDLTSKKILPAIEKLSAEDRLPENFALVGVARKAEEEFRKTVKFSKKLYYHESSFEEELGYENLANLLDEIDRGLGSKSNRIYFLATQPSYFPTIIKKLSNHGLIYPATGREWSRVMIEKPFGQDLNSAIELQKNISQFLDESQIYRIDHYLGKEGVQNLIDFRLHGELESRWNKEHIAQIDITLAEEIGIGTRAKLWEETGLIRDIVQNHILQLLSLVAMEVGNDIPKEKIKALEAARPIESVIRGQYGPGIVQGKQVVGYTEEKGVPSSSTVETYAAGKIFIENERWQGVPFTIQGGKRLSDQLTEIKVTFKNNEVLHIRIQPKPAIYFEKGANLSFEPFMFSEAYQKLIYDCIHGDQTAFVQKEEQFAAWRILKPALESDAPLIIYPAGSSNF